MHRFMPTKVRLSAIDCTQNSWAYVHSHPGKKSPGVKKCDELIEPIHRGRRGHAILMFLPV